MECWVYIYIGKNSSVIRRRGDLTTAAADSLYTIRAQSEIVSMNRMAYGCDRAFIIFQFSRHLLFKTACFSLIPGK